MVDVGDRPLTSWIDEQAIDRIQILVAGGAIHVPIGWERLAVAEDLFDDDVQRTRPPLGFELLAKGWRCRGPGQFRIVRPARLEKMASARQSE